MKNRKAYVVYLLLEGLFALFFGIVVTVNLVYQVEVAHLNPLQLVLVGTALEATYFVCTVPTGVVADVYSRRWAVIIGVFLTGAGFMLEGSIPRFETIVLSQAIWAVGAAFISGAEEAWIASEVGDEQIGQVYLRGSQVNALGTLVGIVISVAVASIRLNLAILLGGALYLVLGLLLLIFMPEHNFRSAEETERHSWRTLGETLRTGGRMVRDKPLLLTIILISAFYGMASEGFDRLWTAHFLEDFTLPSLGHLQPVVWFGIIRAEVMILTIGVTELVRRRFDTNRHATVTWLLFAMSTLRIASVIVFGLAGNFALALAAFTTSRVMSNANTPIYTAWLTQHIDAKVRATVISMSGQMDAIGQIVGGPIIGVIGTLVSIRAALVSTAVFLSPALLLFGRARRQGKETE
ncbi:MAG TPA: MFS transporter [Ktedonobacteraceae bacterium]|nr:MFS transporter [Ktedonobacteraceae bacterium]